MKKAGSSLRDCGKILSILFAAFLFSMTGFSENPKISNYLKNLSSQVNPKPLDDINPELVISGNTIHVVWIEYEYGAENRVFYCRSTDLGKTWEAPRVIGKLKDSQYAKRPESRNLAVDGANVHIAFCDYDYYADGIGKILYYRSANGGASFDPVKEIINTGPGGHVISTSHIEASGGKVAIA